MATTRCIAAKKDGLGVVDCEIPFRRVTETALHEAGKEEVRFIGEVEVRWHARVAVSAGALWAGGVDSAVDGVVGREEFEGYDIADCGVGEVGRVAEAAYLRSEYGVLLMAE